VITVVGEALVDLVVAPDGSVTATLGGAPYNAARAAARLGASTRFAGALSIDRFGALLAARLEADGVDTQFGRRTERPTTLAAAELDEHGSATYRFYIDGTSAPDLPSGSLGELPADPLFFTGGLALTLEPMAATVIEHLRGLHDDTMVVIDVNARPAVVADRARYVANLVAAIGRADVVKVSEEDLAFLHGDLAVDDLLAAGTRAIVVTAGAAATTVHHECGVTSIDVRPPAAPVVDTIGAGDTFVGALMATWIAGLGMPARSRVDLAGPGGFDAIVAAVDVAHAAASIVVTRQGADPPTRDELLDALTA
jgi:fructokinase